MTQVLDRTRYKVTVLEGLLYLASNRGHDLLPTEWEFKTSEILGGTYEYMTGREFNETYLECRWPSMSDLWVNKVNKRLNVVDGKTHLQTVINRELAETLRHWIELGWSRERSESWYDNTIRTWYLFGGNISLNSTFSFTIIEAKKIEEELQGLDPETLKHMEGIAEVMKKYVAADLEYIRAHYRW